MFNITSKYFTFLDNKPPARWVTHIGIDFLHVIPACIIVPWLKYQMTATLPVLVTKKDNKKVVAERKWYFDCSFDYYHVKCEFQSESTLYSLHEYQGTTCSKQASYLKFKWQQRDSNPQSKWTLNHLAKRAKWLSCVVSTYLYRPFDCM